MGYIEGALTERVNSGSKEEPDYRPKYTVEQILDDDFFFDLPAEKKSERERQMAGIEALKAMAGVSGGRVKVIKT